MNAVEIEEAVSKLAEAPFDSEAFPFAFIEAFGNKPRPSNGSKAKAVAQINPIYPMAYSSTTIST